jgi:hypothetical protein
MSEFRIGDFLVLWPVFVLLRNPRRVDGQFCADGIGQLEVRDEADRGHMAVGVFTDRDLAEQFWETTGARADIIVEQCDDSGDLLQIMAWAKSINRKFVGFDITPDDTKIMRVLPIDEVIAALQGPAE